MRLDGAHVAGAMNKAVDAGMDIRDAARDRR
jgi:hypothetical protein